MGNLGVGTATSPAPLVYSSASPDAILERQKYGRERISEKLEDTMAWLAVIAAEHGYKRIIAAGGETSGAVAKALECSSYRIGQSVAPGVPILIPLEKNDIRLVFKLSPGTSDRKNFLNEQLK